MRSSPDDRPDALIIADDNIVEPVTRGLLASEVSLPANLDIVAHCNLPNLPQAAVPVRFLGYDCRQMLNRCIELLDAQRGTMSPASADESSLPPALQAVFANDAGASADGAGEVVALAGDHAVG